MLSGPALRRQCAPSFWLTKFGLWTAYFCVWMSRSQAARLQRAAPFGCFFDMAASGAAKRRLKVAFQAVSWVFQAEQPGLPCEVFKRGKPEQPGWPDRGFPCTGGSLHRQAKARLLCSAGYYGRPFEARNKTKGGAFAADKDYFSFRVGDQQVGLLDGAKGKSLGAYCWPCAGWLVLKGNPSFAQCLDPELS